MLKSVLISSLLIGSNSFAANTIEEKTFPAKDLSQLEIENSSGNVEIKVGSGDSVILKTEKIRFDDKCTLKDKVESKTLKIQLESSLNGNCKVNFSVTVPEKFNLEIDTGSGEIKIDGIKGEVELSSGSGDIVYNGESSKFKSKTGSGDVKINGLTGDADIKTGSGDVSITYIKAPEKGESTIKTGSGDITIQVPANANILSNLRSGSGKLYNELGDNKDAKFKVSAMTGSGDLTIKKK